ncbi:pre-rRNA-processing protein TSR1 homolog [Latimeria chalumnae]|uniref:Pre-rRNA-processing protein TSR1 homolog n=1 Tax=Latimeria chalumnae TaxID=7897 RepID=H2ZYJ0_LATCH|nr:PREDICTED: pre-rRNA-processing protein TSR1 homolog [Latimeria chalumnae]|eukprot:XP_006011048.1 PREDICTED: pre-rRNA-processing protein TSR1 homolog [Latimeria chalumnae]
MAAGDEPHRPGAFKQANKRHKRGKHRSKGELERQKHGRVGAKVLTKNLKREMHKLDRKHKANQIRKQKKDAILMEKRNLGSKDGPPHLVVVIPLHAGINSQSALKLLQNKESAIVYEAAHGGNSFGLVLPRFKHRFHFAGAAMGDLHGVLDLAKVADTLLFILDPYEGWDNYGDYCLSCLFAQGLPSYVLVTQSISELPVKKRTDVKKNLSCMIEKRFPEGKLLSLDTQQEAMLLARQIAAQKQRHLGFRDRRTYMLAQGASFEPSDSSGLVGTLKVSGYVRGRALNVNRLVHIVGHGDFQVDQIDASPDPIPLNPRRMKILAKIGADMEIMDEASVEAEMEEGVKVLMKADPSQQESLQSEIVPDPMEAEQTWPTKEELQEAEGSLKQARKVVKNVPKGMSDYQATWIIDDEDSGENAGDGSDEDEEEEEEDMDQHDSVEETGSQGGDGSEEEEDKEECETMTIAESMRDDHYDEKIDEEEEEKMLEKYRQERMDEMFPDEVDTPNNVASRIRYQKYKGLKSFRTSPWDPKENLPWDYARIFQFQNFARTRKRVFTSVEEEDEAEGVMVGWYVTVHIPNVPASILTSFNSGSPMVLVSLLPHEQKMSVLHLLVRRHLGNDEPVKAKEEMVFHCGFRRFRASPLYSQHTSADKHKYERFLRSDTAVVATVFAPITFPPASVLMFKQRSNGMQDLIATGSVLKVDPDRVIIKRIVLSGHPFKIMKNTAVVRYMFFNKEDVLWFKPVELRTKWGRRGHIKESLGTHGHMKCVFDGQLKSQDTVLLNLYKRVFPKWTFDPYVPKPMPWVKNENVIDVQEIEVE